MKSPTSRLLAHLHDPIMVSRRAAAAAKRHGLRRRVLARTAMGPVEAYETVGTTKGMVRPRVYLSAGLHGDEAGAVEGLLRWMEGKGNRWFSRFDFTIVPCLNPGGLLANSRTGPDGLDWNRSFALPTSHEVIDPLKKAIRARGPFDLALLLHEDYDGCGLYLYEIASSKEASWGADLLAAAEPFLPTDGRPTIEGTRARRGVIARNLGSPALRALIARIGMPEAAWLWATRLVPRVYTVEAPSEFDACRRADGLRAVIEKALSLLREEKEL